MSSGCFIVKKPFNTRQGMLGLAVNAKHPRVCHSNDLFYLLRYTLIQYKCKHYRRGDNVDPETEVNNILLAVF